VAISGVTADTIARGQGYYGSFHAYPVVTG